MSGDRVGAIDRSVLERLGVEELSLALAEESAEASYEMLRSGATSVPVGPVTSFVMGMDDSDDFACSEDERMAPSDPTSRTSPSGAYDFESLPF